MPFSQQDWYAAPAAKGAADHTSLANAGLIGTWLSDASKCGGGTRLWLDDGVYSGAGSMIHPTISGIDGTPGGIITIQAINEGAVTLDGGGTSVPIQTVSADTVDYYNIIGINVHNSSGNGCTLNDTIGWLVQRCVAYDQADLNTYAFAVNYGTYNVIEDCAGWGTFRKGVLCYSTSGPNVVRRHFSKWTKSTQTGPKMGMSLSYNSFQTTFENCIATWDGATMPDPYTIKQADGTFLPYLTGTGTQCPSLTSGPGIVQANTSCLVTGGQVASAYAPFSHDNNPASPTGTPVNSKLLGCIGYGKTGSVFQAPRIFFNTQENSVTLKDCVAIYESGGTFGATKNTFQLAAGTRIGAAPFNLYATNLSSFKGLTAGNSIHADWSQTNVIEAVDPASYYTVGESLYNTTRGAAVRYRYIDGVLTTQSLWPWPMNSRIVAAGGPDVDAAIQGMFGAYPSVPAGAQPHGRGRYPVNSRLGLRTFR